MPKDSELMLESFSDLIDDSSPLKSLIDRRIVPSNDKRVKIVGNKRPNVKDFFHQITSVNQSNLPMQITSNSLQSQMLSPHSLDHHTNYINSNNSSCLVKTNYSPVNVTQNNNHRTPIIDNSLRSNDNNNGSAKSEKWVLEQESGFKFIKWTPNHSRYKVSGSTKKTSGWLFEGKSEDEDNATIISMKVNSTESSTGDSYHLFLNQEVRDLNKKCQKDGERKSISPISRPMNTLKDQVLSHSEAKIHSSEPLLATIHNHHDIGSKSRKEARALSEPLIYNIQSTLTLAQANVESNEKRRIGEIIRNLLRRRPTLEYLREKGIFRDEPVFGCDLKTLCKREGLLVPRIVRDCVQSIDQNLETDGIYRICGNLSEVQKLRFQVNHGNYNSIPTQSNVHVVTGLLKLFLRDLKEPLLPFELFNSFIKAADISDKEERKKVLKRLVKNLPEFNYHTFKYLVEHFLRVVANKDKNRMQIQNLAIVLGPSLMWPRINSKDLSYDMMLSVNCNKIVEELMNNFSELFLLD